MGIEEKLTIKFQVDAKEVERSMNKVNKKLNLLKGGFVGLNTVMARSKSGFNQVDKALKSVAISQKYVLANSKAFKVNQFKNINSVIPGISAGSDFRANKPAQVDKTINASSKVLAAQAAKQNALIKQEMANFNRLGTVVAKNEDKKRKEYEATMKVATRNAKKIQASYKTQTKYTRAFRGEMLGLGLSTMFMGMALQRFAGGALKSIFAVFGDFDNGTFKMQDNLMQLTAGFKFLKLSIVNALEGTVVDKFIIGLTEKFIALADLFQEHPEWASALVTTFGIIFGVGTIAMVGGQITTFLSSILGKLTKGIAGDSVVEGFKTKVWVPLTNLIAGGLIIKGIIDSAFGDDMEIALIEILGGLSWFIPGPFGAALGAIAFVLSVGKLQTDGDLSSIEKLSLALSAGIGAKAIFKAIGAGGGSIAIMALLLVGDIVFGTNLFGKAVGWISGLLMKIAAVVGQAIQGMIGGLLVLIGKIPLLGVIGDWGQALLDARLSSDEMNAAIKEESDYIAGGLDMGTGFLNQMLFRQEDLDESSQSFGDFMAEINGEAVSIAPVQTAFDTFMTTLNTKLPQSIDTTQTSLDTTFKTISKDLTPAIGTSDTSEDSLNLALSNFNKSLDNNVKSQDLVQTELGKTSTALSKLGDVVRALPEHKTIIIDVYEKHHYSHSGSRLDAQAGGA